MNELTAVIQTLRGLFKDKDRLVGIDDWDAFIGCLIVLEQLANKPPDELEETTVEE